MARTPRQDARVAFVEANGLRFGYLEWGAGPLVLLLHGFPDTAYSWQELGPQIAAAGYRVVAPFLRGYAPTAIPDVDTDSEQLGRDVLALIAALGAARAHIIGHDWGAEAVYAAVALGPERIERAVTIAIPHRSAMRYMPALLWIGRHFATLRMPGAERRFAADDYAMVEVLFQRWSPTWRYTAEDLDPVKDTFAAPGSLRAALGYYRAVRYRTPGYLRAPLAVPVLCIGGTEDPALDQATFERSRRYCAGGFTLAMIPGGHFCHRESPRAFLDAVLAFLRAT